MIISPPFLPQHSASGSDTDRLAEAMDIGAFGDGSFPLGINMTWHGGVHLTAPRDGNTRLPVRAIADGEVAYVRQPKPQNNDPDDPLNYRGWTDDGCVIIKHATEIGEGVSVEIFSIMLHLKQVAVKQGQKVWRKDKLGEAGSIEGESGRIHFEIIAGDLTTLVGRKAGSLSTVSNGRATCVFGNVYMLLPAGTPFFDSIPTLPEHPEPFTTPSNLPHPAWISDKPLVVGVNLARTRGAMLTTRTVDGVHIGNATASADNELFHLAERSAQAQHAVARDVYELLRFGRVLEPKGDTRDLSNWQQVAYPGGTAWVDLHASGIPAFSDADFPDWANWQIIDDDDSADSRCGSRTLIDQILQSSSNASLKQRRIEALTRVSSVAAQSHLTRAICKFPTEWQKSTIAVRWHWLTTDTPPGAGMLAGPYLSHEDFQKFQKHTEALCFWDEANLGIPADHWHFHPREFIHLFRQCGWLSSDEMIQLFPQTAMREAAHHRWVSESVPVLPSLIEQYHTELNKACRRYGIVTPLRIAAFYANSMVETQWFGHLEERINTTHPPRYYPWNGRGFMQLTWPDNYIKYWRFIGKIADDALAQSLHDAAQKADREHSSAPLAALDASLPSTMKAWRTFIGNGRHPEAPADSAGAYWAWSDASAYADAEPANTRDSRTAAGHPHVYYTSDGMGNVAATVNLGHPSTHYSHVNGIVARFQAYATCEVVLLDTPIFPDGRGQSTPTPENYEPRHP